MNKDVIAEYCDRQEECRDIRKRIEADKRELKKMEKEKIQVADSVKGTRQDGTYGNITIRGVPMPLYCRKMQALKENESKLEVKETELLELQNITEDYIQSIDDSRMRRILRYRYLDNLSWTQVACRMGKHHTAESCRKANERFFENN